jgi:hypothetical protein
MVAWRISHNSNSLTAVKGTELIPILSPAYPKDRE